MTGGADNRLGRHISAGHIALVTEAGEFSAFSIDGVQEPQILSI